MTKKSLYIIIGFLTGLLAFSMTYIAFYNMPGLRNEIKDLKTEVAVQKEMIQNQNFDLNTLSIANQSLRLDIVDKDLEIVRLEADGMAYEDAVKIMEYCVLYIHVLQVRMGEQGIDYPVFIIESVLNEILEERAEG